VTPVTPGGPPIWVGGLTPAGLRRAARLSDGVIALARTPEDLAKVRGELLALRERYGRDGDYPIYTQAPPPDSIAAAKEMARTWRDAGADGLILTYDGIVPDVFLAQEDVVRALIETAA
jgi:hypothetical protein